ncbi:MAG: prepilin peptidase, partial [Nitrososphaerales archaeon]
MLLDIRLVLCGVMLFVSAYFDLKSREVDDRVWWVFGALGLALTASEALVGFNPNQLLMYLVSAAVSGAVAFTLYYLGFYGGADAKALSVCALITPIFDRNLTLHPFTPLIILVNSTILTASLAIYYGFSNLTRILRGEKIFEGLEHEPIYRKALASILGFRVKGKVGSFYYLME